MAATPPPIKLPTRVVATKVQVSDVGYRKDKDTVIPDQEQKFFNTGVKDLRQLDHTRAIRILTRVNGTFSAALNSYLQLAMSSGYRITGYSAGSHQFDPGATLTAMTIAASMDTLYDYTEGFSSKQSLSGTLETLLKEVLQTGACMTELVLNKFKLPENIACIPTNSIEWVSKTDGGRYPRQIPTGTGGDPINLNLATVDYAATAQQSNSIFPRSPFESALNMIYMFTELLEDVFKVIRRAGHSRLVAKLLQEAVQNMADPETQNDPEKMAQFFENVRKQVQDTLSQLGPDDALVTYDTVEVASISSKGEKADYTAILETMAGMLASSLKSMPSILGMRSQGSQSLSNTESLVFLKMCAGIRTPVETVMSRALTLATRLAGGVDAYVEFRFKPIELRTESELSAHKAVLYQDVMRKLSMGFYTMDEAAHALDMFPRGVSTVDLAGKLFMGELTGSAGDPGIQPKDMVTQNDGAQQKSGNAGTKTSGIPPANGGGNPKG